ncbi:MAG: hypothetical protein JXR76_04915 [Deltaproteobacteria bacterium]|nr:hypothetical protein [Deltaproteobacteria bacterium]
MFFWGGGASGVSQVNGAGRTEPLYPKTQLCKEIPTGIGYSWDGSWSPVSGAIALLLPSVAFWRLIQTSD